jgi:hypothetical protein
MTRRLLEAGAKALDDDVCGRRSLFGGILPTSPPVMLDDAGENLPFAGYSVGACQRRFLHGGTVRLSSSAVALGGAPFLFSCLVGSS